MKKLRLSSIKTSTTMVRDKFRSVQKITKPIFEFLERFSKADRHRQALLLKFLLRNLKMPNFLSGHRKEPRPLFTEMSADAQQGLRHIQQTQNVFRCCDTLKALAAVAYAQNIRKDHNLRFF